MKKYFDAMLVCLASVHHVLVASSTAAEHVIGLVHILSVFGTKTRDGGERRKMAKNNVRRDSNARPEPDTFAFSTMAHQKLSTQPAAVVREISTPLVGRNV